VAHTIPNTRRFCYTPPEAAAVTGRFSGFMPGFRHPARSEGPAHWFAFQGDKMLVRIEDGEAVVPYAGTLDDCVLACGKVHFLGTVGGRPCLTAEIPAGEAPRGGWRFEGLRPLFGSLPEDTFRLASRAVEILGWDRTHRFCGRCGTALADKTEERAKLCPSCGFTDFPKFSAAVIVAVVRDNRILLARKKQFASGMWSVLAGFVEAGESLEECVRREVREESGLEVTDIRYAGSQHWPFPDSLMIGFTARWAGGEITVDRRELDEAQWYPADGLPEIPGPLTIARKLIDGFIATGCRG
jgi:NAD+ diphosphatase